MSGDGDSKETLDYASSGLVPAPSDGLDAMGATIAEPHPFDVPASSTTGPVGSAVRAYADGVFTTVTRDTVSKELLAKAQAVTLPYSSQDVIRRIGSYDILAELGRGGMGVVYKAYSLRLCRPCALKLMIAGEYASEVQLVRFQNEAMLAARLRHPNIVQVFDAGEVDDKGGEFYFVMEFVEGRPLDDLAGDASYSTRDLARVIAKTARALEYAHGHGIVHRDIKPDNILVSADGEPHITDFGIAANVKTEKRITNEGALMGTPAYMSPEQINGEIARIGPASDQYSLGASLFHMVTGREPFTAETTIDLLIKAMGEDAPMASAVAKAHSKRDVELDLDTIIAKTLEKKTGDRYGSLGALADDLEAYLEDRPIAARPVSGAERLRKLIRRNRAAFVVSAVVFTTLLVVGAAFGAVTVFNIERTSETIREQDRQAGLEQAATLERAIRVNMLQGRADVVRELVTTLRDDPKAKSIDVVRVDRSFAYTDKSTAKDVVRRLSRPGYLDKILKLFPEFDAKIKEAKRLALPYIDKNAKLPGDVFAYDTGKWNAMVEKAEPQTLQETIDGEPVLTVFKPIKNSEKCQVCHGAEDEAGYSNNHVRAVLVVRRSQKTVEDRIEENKSTTRTVGIGTAGAILALVFLFARIFGLRFRRRRYAD